MTKTITVLQTNALPERTEAALRERFTVVRIPESATERTAFLRETGPQIRAIAGTGKGKVDAGLIENLPNLEIISSYSAGLDNIDTAAAARRSIPVVNTSAILADDVADLALWLLIAVSRNLVAADSFVRAGEWAAQTFPLGRSVAELKVGIIGLGHIGKSLARRLDVVGARIAYHGRSEQPDVSYPYFATPAALAAWSQALVVCCPATRETDKIVSADVLAALGPDGMLVNVSRGSTVDEGALIAALASGSIAGAGLDVFAAEPHVPQALVADRRVVVLPHLGSATSQTRDRMGDAMIGALVMHFA